MGFSGCGVCALVHGVGERDDPSKWMELGRRTGAIGQVVLGYPLLEICCAIHESSEKKAKKQDEPWCRQRILI